MSSPELASFHFTDAYLELLYAEVRVAELGADATPAEINKLSAARMELNAMDEKIRYQLQQRNRL
jgi:hypothetical protein